VLSLSGRDDRAPTSANRLSTCLVVSHCRAVLERADQILFLQKGRIASRGALEELLERSQGMRRLRAMGAPSPEIDPPA
jgi:ABC-type bacteriocin/lantibiotic exporter with double-glycine peptidase domain